MRESQAKLVEVFQNKYDVKVHIYADEINLTIAPEFLIEAATSLRDKFGFDLLVDETAVDYCPQDEPRFHLIYQFISTATNQFIRLRVPVSGKKPIMQTLESVYPNANWYEREIWDLFGIKFQGHSDLRRLVLPEDWEGHPLRKDYPQGYEEVQFTFNREEIDRKKIYPKE